MLSPRVSLAGPQAPDSPPRPAGPTSESMELEAMSSPPVTTVCPPPQGAQRLLQGQQVGHRLRDVLIAVLALGHLAVLRHWAPWVAQPCFPARGEGGTWLPSAPSHPGTSETRRAGEGLLTTLDRWGARVDTTQSTPSRTLRSWSVALNFKLAFFSSEGH